MPAGKAQESIGEAIIADCLDDNAIVMASPVSSLAQRMSNASFHGPAPAASATPIRPTGTVAAAACQPLPTSESVRFGIDDSNDSMSFALLERRRQTEREADEDDEEEADWVLSQPAVAGDDDSVSGSDGTPCRPKTLTFCSSPSEPTMRRRLWPTAEQQPPPPPPRFASVPFGYATSPTAAATASRKVRPVETTLPPPAQQPPRRRSFKRPSPTSVTVADTEVSDSGTVATPTKRQAATPKRRRLAKTPLGDATNHAGQQPQPQQPPSKKPVLLRSTSEMSALATKSGVAEASSLDSDKVDNAIESIDTLNLIGNSEQKHSLPTVAGNYGIRYVTGATVSRLVRGDFGDKVPNYAIIDCRFPYEYRGGHIRGAVNIYKQEDLISQVMEPTVARAADSDRSAASPVLIFHCEFSSERAPRLARHLRQRDRDLNKYPDLYFPEVYVLQGGYKRFFESHKEYCDPLNYTRMTDPSFKAELAAIQRDRKAWERQNSRSRHTQLQRLASCQQLH